MEELTQAPVEKFITDYNALFNMPSTKANMAICAQYKLDHPNEFKTSDWSITKHRKRFMDWMSRQNSDTLSAINK